MITDLRCSSALESIIGPESSIQDFFEQTWQKECKIFRSTNRHQLPPTNQQNAPKTTSIEPCPLTNLVDNAWPALVSLLQQARGRFEDDGNKNDDNLAPVFFSHGTPVPPDPYNNSLFHAYLDGCSVVINHADWISAEIAHLCFDLTKSIPHVYANTYLTPPSSQAVAPHADDRDVFVIQLIGKKHWKVYKTVPIPYPYPAEQVGKAELKVPKQILKGPTVFNTVLEPGDVLYMPRGYVHEAHTLLDECSFHVTIAMPTHDWTLAGAMTAATHHALCQVVDYRMALPTSLFSNTNSSTNGDLEIVNQQLNQALQRVQQQVTIESIMNDLQTKTKHHNERANAKLPP